MSSGYSTCSELFCFLYLLILVKEKMNVSVTVHFPDYAFNENIHNMYFFFFWQMECFPETPFLWETKKLKSTSLLRLDKKETFACTIFGKICYVACTIDRAGQINRDGQLICLHASLHECHHAGLIDKPALKRKVQ